MTRAQEIQSLQARLARANAERKHKTASLIYARLKSLMTRELRAEMRRKTA